jgi:hypothetical protein
MEDPAGYSPAALVFLDFTWRHAGVRTIEGKLEWNVRPAFVAGSASYRLRISPTSIAEIKYDSAGAALILNGRTLCRTRNTVRLITSRDGTLQNAIGIGSARTNVTLEIVSGRTRTFSIEPNSTINLRSA